MLKEIHLNNWKSFKQATLYIDPLTVLIGTNASGKSNVLEGLEFLRRMASGENIESALTALRGGLEWATLKSERQFTLSVLIEAKATDYFYSLTVEIDTQSKIVNERLISINNNKNIFQKIDEQTDKIYLYALKESIEAANLVINTLQNIFILEPVPTHMRTYTPLSHKLSNDAKNIAGVLAALPDTQQTCCENILSYYAKQLPEGDIHKVWAEKVGKLNSDAMLYCEEEWVNGEITLIDARSMSDGTLRFLAILTALLTRPSNSQLIIEDVDNGLHPSRAGLLLQILQELGRQRNIDILVTTHNPALLDNLAPEMVPFIEVAHRDNKTGTSKLTLLEDISNLPKLLASGTLGKITTQGKLERSLTRREAENA
ncbi:AAA family ATPase [Candidatus Marithrix sp. Canyon 246]|uniref:AAA family ATPase n=1 Tax=Candidatus Marithrix sp. Canyon 246 TaxID=1827136 RepID=UPI00084A24F7|nr:ATP-binding protein [Candidatus Marithrix sp. Canyon 246]